MHRANFTCRQLLAALITATVNPKHPNIIVSYYSTMQRDYVRELGLDEPNEARSSPPRIHIKDKQRVNMLISQLIRGGRGKLQVLSDFDRTITKQHEHGKIHVSSFGIFALVKRLPDQYREEDQRLTAKYLPIEVDPNIAYPEKKALMEEWWCLSEKLVAGNSVSPCDLEEVVTEVCMSLRDNAVETFEHLKNHNIPLLVFSAGIGDVVAAVLLHYKILTPNVKIVSNFLKRDADGVIQGFDGKMINSFNKNEMVLLGTPYYDTIIEKCNMIVMGDSIGDAWMADGMPNSRNILKIGYLYENAAGNLPNYQKHFDIVLEDDQSMNVIFSILKLIDTDEPIDDGEGETEGCEEQLTGDSTEATK